MFELMHFEKLRHWGKTNVIQVRDIQTQKPKQDVTGHSGDEEFFFFFFLPELGSFNKNFINCTVMLVKYP